MKHLLHILGLVMALLVLGACVERSARTDHPKSYNKAGMGFEYPGNWKVTEDVQQAGFRYIFVETPGSAIVFIQIYPTNDAMEIKEFAQNFSQSAKENMSFGTTFSASRFGRVEKSDGYEIMAEKCSVIFLGEDIPHTRTYRRKSIADRVCFIIAQVADEDRPKVTKGFEQVVSSFRYETP